MDFKGLVNSIKETHQYLQAEAAKSVNISITTRNWVIGYYIQEFEQKGEDRAKYGDKLLPKLEKQFIGSGIKGMTARRFREYRRFYTIYPYIRLAISKILPHDTIRRLPTAGLESAIWRLPTAELEDTGSQKEIH